MLQAEKNSVRYHKKLAPKYLNTKETFCVLRQNGIEKTTTVNVFLGVTKPAEGDTLINSISVKTNQKVRSSLAYIPETVQLYTNLSGLENLDLFCQSVGKFYTEYELFKFLLDASLKGEACHKKLKTYSKVMRQKVVMAIALARNASYILMSEPNSDLDSKAEIDFSNACQKLLGEGIQVLKVANDIFKTVDTCTKIGAMKEGTLIHISDEMPRIKRQELQEVSHAV